MVCRVLEVVQAKHRRLLIAEVVECCVSGQFVTTADVKHQVADSAKLDPIIYALDNSYYRTSNVIGTGTNEGVCRKVA